MRRDRQKAMWANINQTKRGIIYEPVLGEAKLV